MSIITFRVQAAQLIHKANALLLKSRSVRLALEQVIARFITGNGS